MYRQQRLTKTIEGGFCADQRVHEDGEINVAAVVDSVLSRRPWSVES